MSQHYHCLSRYESCAADPLDPDFLQRIVDPHASGPSSSGEGVYTMMLNPCPQADPPEDAHTSSPHFSELPADEGFSAADVASPSFTQPHMDGYRCYLPSVTCWSPSCAV